MTKEVRTGAVFAVAAALLIAALAVQSNPPPAPSRRPVAPVVAPLAPPPRRTPRVPPAPILPPPERIRAEPPIPPEPPADRGEAGRVPGTGPLEATLSTNLGDIHCALFERQAPLAVDAFVGLANGWRAYKDPETGAWTRGRFYDGVTFHRVVPGFVIQAGDPTGKGTYMPGFNYPLELDPVLHHTAGTLAVAHKGPNPDGSFSNGSQFYIALDALPHLDGDYTIFGQCRDLDVARAIAALPTAEGDRPKQAVTLRSVRIERVR